jgi:SNF2 family DNA or RNA helicase
MVIGKVFRLYWNCWIINALSTHRHKTPLVNKPSLSILQARIEAVSEEFADDCVYEETIEDLVETASYLFHQPDAKEQALLQSLYTYAKTASLRSDAKATALIKWLKDNIRADGEWGDKRVLIFTEYRATQKWLYDLLAAEGLTRDDRLMMLYGGMESDKRERIKAAFQAHPSQAAVRILLATDAASEGIDLQNHCAHLIHYEIPWNPNRLEQRNGRLDRHGQRADKVVIYHFVSQGYQQRLKQQRHLNPGELEGDLEFLMRAVIKVDNIREDLGRVGPVIAEQVEQAMLGKRQQLDTVRAEQQASTIRKRLSFERNLAAQLKKLYQQLQDTKQELHLSPSNIQQVVEVGLTLAGQPPLQATESDGIFLVPPLSGSWAHCTKGLAHPHTQKIRPIVFDWELARHRDDVVLVHLNHRLVQMSLHLLRAEVWSSKGRQKLHRVTARLIPSLSLDTPAVIGHARIVVLGGDNHRLHEEIITTGGYLREGRFARIKGVEKIQTLLDAALPTAPPQDFQNRLADLWKNHKDNLIKALEARQQVRTKNLQKFLDDRAQKEVADITAILQELQRNIEAELKTEDIPQLALWTEPEKAQLKRDRSNLEHRLNSIPAEIERETKAIQARYANAVSRLFPVAVTYLVPEKLVSSTTD